MPRASKALTDTAIKALKPKDKRYLVGDTGGLVLEVMTSGSKVWRYRYTLFSKRQPLLTIGKYPEVSLKAARERRDEWAELVASGKSPKWLIATEKAAHLQTVAAFAEDWLSEQQEGKSGSYSTTLRRVMDKDVLPWLGAMPLSLVKPADVLEMCDRIKARGSPQMALQSRNVLRRMFDYAIARRLVEANPAAAIVARFIASQSSRERVLSAQEIGDVMRAIYLSDMRRVLKLALHLLAITMVRKTELTETQWAEFDLAAGIWDIPTERMKVARPHRVYLSKQAILILQELQALSCGSIYVFPSTRGSGDRPISSSTLNQAVRAMTLDIQHFVLHDFRRTASTHLHDMGHPLDAIEKALAHKIVGIKGVYNRAEYSEQRKTIMQAWADFVQAQIDGGNIIPLFKVA
jgi:integrase